LLNNLALLGFWATYGADPLKLREAQETHARMKSDLKLLKKQVANLERQKKTIENEHE
jgi:hypothetical protein